MGDSMPEPARAPGTTPPVVPVPSPEDRGLLACPVCAGPLERTEPRRLSCASGHRYDAAKQGYFNLLTGRGTKFREDTAEMVAARASFQAAGYYDALADAVADQVLEHLDIAGGRRGAPDPAAGPVRIVDAGAGTGFYLARTIDALESYAPGVQAAALDISRYAMRRAARVPHTTALVWDLWRRLPLRDAGADVLLNVFAPRNGAEYRRIVRPGGLAVVVTPLPHHLAEVRDRLGMLGIAGGKEEAVGERLTDAFERIDSTSVESTLELDGVHAVDLALMGPAGHHADRDRIQARLDQSALPLTATAAFRIQSFRRRGPQATDR
ncbi:rRNA (guanine-N1)-methyltransferase [Zhihengliuella alba]|uniref:rRNA (Guanine-N1)-methyltransferase n=1 Tax=Zhihengliuella alba TaxID=547018 RepID=A0ABP7CS59_9MICC